MVADARAPALLDLARRNKVLHALDAVRDDLRTEVPVAMAQLDAYRLRTLAINRACLATAVRVTDALSAGGIPHALFKGPIQQMLLHGSPMLKASADVDVLVAPVDRARAAAIVESLGYRTSDARLARWWVGHLGEQHFDGPAGAPTIDLHHALHRPGSPGLRDPERLLANVRPVTVEGRAVPTLSAVDTCLVVALNVVKALLAREPCLDHVADLRRALARLDPQEARALEAAAAHQGLAETLAAARALAARLLERESPGADPLGFIDEETLVRMVVAPWMAGADAPRRRRLLYALCGRAPLRFLREAARAFAAEAVRKRLERPA
ncbi:nucleotidyltransferase family protein [Salinarimonas ramus]|uniref:Nucleotidyltransferase family protein n=1 Tax=Salinarimonas ramus TaxID=690164 RepID=A0A917Q990_9HYPH|nr:nucleotidyltransferase family protein [Salinarimonas ramus]GGK37725.1 hypothetical protein GCM10011322_25940 [Salinarimonas ramus]